MKNQVKFLGRWILCSVVAVYATVCVSGPIYAMDVHFQLDKGRSLFYQAVEEESKLDSAMTLFRGLAESSDSLRGRAETYIGALISLKGKHAFFPRQKLQYVKQGLIIMELGVKKSHHDLESLFIYGSTCYHLPFFFGKAEEAQQAFSAILNLPSEKLIRYDPEVVTNALEFIEKSANLSDAQKRDLLRLQTVMAAR